MYIKMLLLLLCIFSEGIHLQAQNIIRKMDSTMKLGKVGYRVTCFNKNLDKNTASVLPIGFDKAVREFSFEIKGRIVSAEVDDVNRDGYPDLMIYVVNNDSIPKGNVIGISSEKNENVAPIMFPDIFDDPKLRVGYKGNDSYFLMEGNLMRRFQVYPVEGLPVSTKPGILYRQIQYQVVPGDRGGFKFKPLRSYEFIKQ